MRAFGRSLLNDSRLVDQNNIIVVGRVRVEIDGLPVCELGEREILGELAAIDPQPRSASIIAVADTVLFKMSHRTLFELIACRYDVAKGIIHTLCQRIRRAEQAS